jgi:hypothetical protein
LREKHNETHKNHSYHREELVEIVVIHDNLGHDGEEVFLNLRLAQCDLFSV